MSRRFFKHGELPLVLLALVTQRPRHAYELMAELTRLFGPRYRASPGSVYPAIEALQIEGLIEGSPAGGRKVYAVTATGRQAIDERAEMLAALELRVGVRLGDDDSLEASLARFKARVAPLDGRVDAREAERILDRAAAEIEQLHSSRTPKKRRQNAR